MTITAAERQAAAKAGEAMPDGSFPTRSRFEFDAAVHLYLTGHQGPDAAATAAYLRKRAASFNVKGDPLATSVAKSAAVAATHGGHTLGDYLIAELRLAKEAGVEASAEPDGDDLEDQDEEDFAGVCVVLRVPADVASQLAVDGGVPPEGLHLTLAYIADDVDDLTATSVGTLIQAVSQFSLNCGPVTAKTTGAGLFLGDDAATDATAVVLIDSPHPGLAEARKQLHWALGDFGIPWDQSHGLIPHVSLAYGAVDGLTALPLPPEVDVTFDSVLVLAGGQAVEMPLRGAPLNPTPVQELGFGFVKSAGGLGDDWDGYTLAPLYSPDADDSHGEHTTADELAKMAHDFFRSTDKKVHLQHIDGTDAGEIVGQVVWPFEVKCDLVTGAGLTKSVTIPPGTVFQEIIWREGLPRELVREGKVNGLSMGGTGFKLEVAD
jgi:2'-5' RNA ligase